MDLKKGHQGRTRIARPNNQHLLQDRHNCAADSDQEKFTIDTKDFPSLSELSERDKLLEKSSVNNHKIFSYSDKLKAPSQEGITRIVKTKYNIQFKSRLSADQKQSSAGNESASGDSYNKNNYRENHNVMNPKKGTIKNYDQRNQTSFVQQTFSSVHQKHEKDCSSDSKNEFPFPKPSNSNYKSPNCKKKSIHAGMEQTLIKDNSTKSAIGLNKGAYCDNSKNSESKEKSSNFRASSSNYMNPNEASKSVVRNKMASSGNNSDSFNKKPRYCQSNSEAKTTATHTQSNSFSDSRPLRVRLPSQKESQPGGKNVNKNSSFSSRNGNNFTASQNNDKDGKPEGINAEVSGVKKKKKRKSKIKRQTALQSGKLLVLTPEAHSRILNQTNNVTAHSSNTIFTNINDSEEYPELGATSLPKNNKENSANASGMNVKKEIPLQTEAEECDPSLQVSQNFPVSNENLEDSSPKTEKVKIVEEPPVKDEKVVHSNHPITLSLFDMLLTTKPKKKEVEKKKSHINEKPPSMSTTKQVSALSVNPLDSSRPTIKRGKEREKPKAKKPSRMKKLILMGRKLRNENREVPKENEETFDDNHDGNNDDDVDNEITTSSDELTDQRTSPLLSTTEYSSDVESADVTGCISSENMEYNSTFNLPYASKTSLEPKTDELCGESISHSGVFEKNILNSYVGDEKYADEEKHDIVEKTENDVKCSFESTNPMDCKNKSNEDVYLTDIRWLFFNQLDTMIDLARKRGDKCISLSDFISVFEDAITDVKLLFKNLDCNLPICEVMEFPIALRNHLLNVVDVINIAKLVKSDDMECVYDINNHDVTALTQNTLSSSDNPVNLNLLIDHRKIILSYSENNQAIQMKTEYQDNGCDSICHDEISTEIPECNFSDEDRLNATKTLLHSRKFRSYCNHFVSKEIDGAVFSLLDDLARFQDRMHQKDPVKAHIRRRLVYGIKEIKRHMKLKKLKGIIIASDIEDNKTEGGLNDTLKEILSLAEAYHIPYVFSHRRYNLGKLCRKSAPVSCVGIFNYEGSEKNFKKMLELQEESKHDYVEMTEKLSSELTNDQIKKLLVIMNEPATVIYEVTREVLREILLPYLIPKEHSIDDESSGISHNTSTTPGDTDAIMPLRNAEVVTKPEFSNASVESGQSIGYTSSKPLENSEETKIYTIFTKYKLVK